MFLLVNMVPNFNSNLADLRIVISRKQVFCQKFVYNILSRCQSHWSNSEKASYSGFKEGKVNYQVTEKPEENSIGHGPRQSSFNVVNDDLNSNKWKLELAWLSKALEPAVQLCRSVLPTGIFRYECSSILEPSGV